VKIDKAIDDVQKAESALAKELRAIGERHATEHDIYHMTHTLANKCDDHLHELAPIAERYGASTSDNGVPDAPSILQAVRHKSSELLGRSETAGLTLLHDLRKLYMAAQEAELDWVILGQAAQAVRDAELLEVTNSCHEHAEVRGKWLRTRIKESAPQVLGTG
jgi:hypothetical protein